MKREEDVKTVVLAFFSAACLGSALIAEPVVVSMVLVML